jgi:hypothetical protein
MAAKGSKEDEWSVDKAKIEGRASVSCGLPKAILAVELLPGLPRIRMPHNVASR